MARDCDILLFGATGFTGRHVIPVLSKLSKKCGLTWGVAGRSEDKLRRVLLQYLNESESTLSEIPIVVASVEDEESLKNMARKTRLVINCCGPYRHFGEPVVKACVAEGTDHVDVSGEPQYMESIQLKYDKLAKEKGIYIVSACGFDCIPADLGVVFLQQNFNGVVNSVVTYLSGGEEGGSSSGSSLNYATWESAVYGLAHADELKGLRKKLYPERLPKLSPKLKRKTWPHRSRLVGGWALPFPGADRSVIKRSQQYFYEQESKRPIQVETYFVVNSFMRTMRFQILAVLCKILVQSQFGRKLLLQHPEIFSGGLSSTAEPAERKIHQSIFNITLYGEGWEEPSKALPNGCAPPIQKSVVAKVHGRNPSYGATCTALVFAAILILTEREKLPGDGGVYTPGAAFAKTSMIAKLNNNGITFEIVSHL